MLCVCIWHEFMFLLSVCLDTSWVALLRYITWKECLRWSWWDGETPCCKSEPSAAVWRSDNDTSAVVWMGSARYTNCHVQLLYAGTVRWGKEPVGRKIRTQQTHSWHTKSAFSYSNLNKWTCRSEVFNSHVNDDGASVCEEGWRYLWQYSWVCDV